MSVTQEQTIPLYGEIVKGFNTLSASGQTKGESSDLLHARQTAFDKFRLLGFPTIKNEDWKYTNITRFLKEDFALEGIDRTGALAANGGLALAGGFAIPDLDCYRVVLVNGVWDGEVTGGPLPKGIEIVRVADALHDPKFSSYFENGKWGSLHFANLNAALFTDGLLINVTGAVTGKPLHIVHLYSASQNLMVQPRHVWVFNPNSEFAIIESIHSHTSEVSMSGEASISAEVNIFVNSVTEIIVGKDARVDHTVIQAASAGARLVQHTTVRQKKQSLYNNYTFTLPGAALVRNDLQARLEEDHTETHLYGLYLAAGHQLVDNHTLVDHQQPFCFSNELYKGVLLEQATGVFNGKVFVHRDAQKTNAFQQNNNLVISKKATIDSKPELEIFADDVKCSHGSTVGQFSEEALFYLRARGIGEEMAKALLITAFAFDVTGKIKNPAVEAYVRQLISQHIPATNA